MDYEQNIKGVDKMQIIEALKLEMRIQDISQAEMARRIGVSAQQLNNVLQGKDIKFKKKKKICKELGVEVRLEKNK